MQFQTAKIIPPETPKKEEAIELVPLALDRALDEKEIEAEDKAEKIPKGQFKRIHPVPGTIGYQFRDISGGNAAVVEFVESSLPSTARSNSNNIAYRVCQVILLWKKLDEFSQNRVDIFDWLCNKCNVPKPKFFAYASEGMFTHFDSISQRMLMESKPELINNVRQYARKERGFRDRELLAKATNLTKEGGITIDASTKIQTNISYESDFKSTLKATEKVIRGDEDIVEGEIIGEAPETKQLTEGDRSNEITAKQAINREVEEIFAELGG